MPNYICVGGPMHGTVRALPDGADTFQFMERPAFKPLEPIKKNQSIKPFMPEIHRYIVRTVNVDGITGQVLAYEHLTQEEFAAGAVCVLHKYAPPYQHWFTFNKMRLLIEHAALCTEETFEAYCERMYRHGV